MGERVEGSKIHASVDSASPLTGSNGTGGNGGVRTGKGVMGDVVNFRGYAGGLGSHGGSYGAGGSGGGPGQGPRNWRYRKLDMLIFNGTDLDGWILRVERFCILTTNRGGDVRSSCSGVGG